MWEIESYNEELVFLSDALARIRNREFDNAFEEDLPLRRDIWQINAEREELWARFNHLNAVMKWWREQTDFVFSRATGPSSSGFHAPSSDGPPQAMATARCWQSPRTLLHRLYHQPLERALKIWTDDLVRRGMLDPEDLEQIQFDPPIDERLEKKRAEDRARLAEFQANFERVLEKVEAVATKRGRHPGLPHRQALGVWNSRFSERRRDRHTLNDFVRALEKERLLPAFSGAVKRTGDLVKNLLGV